MSKKVWAVEGYITKYYAAFVEADTFEEAKFKIQDGELEFEEIGEVHDVDIDYSTLEHVPNNQLPKGYPRK